MDLLELAKSIGVEGFLHVSELHKLIELACNRDVLEIGSYRGLSAWGMAITAKSVTCVDTFRSCSNGQRQENEFTTLNAFSEATKRFSNVTKIIGTSENVIIGGMFDMIFIDANHTEESVIKDIEKWFPKVRKGGVFVMHDYRHNDFPGIEKAADGVFGPAPEGTTLITLRWIAA